MKPIVFAKDCTYLGKTYLKGTELKKYRKEDLITIWKLNEIGFIEPLSEKDFLEIKNSLNKKVKKIKEGK